MNAEAQASKELAGLPAAHIPVFNTDKELYYFIHNIIMTKDVETVKSYLYKVMSNQCKEEGSDVNLTYLTQQWVNKITNNLTTYKKTHCMQPKVKHYQNGQIRFFDKQSKRALDFEGIQEGGTWKLFSVRYYPARGGEIEAQATMNCN
jgi:ERCC4-related helicase